MLSTSAPSWTYSPTPIDSAQFPQETQRPKIKRQLDIRAHRLQWQSEAGIHPNINDSSRAFSHPPIHPTRHQPPRPTTTTAAAVHPISFFLSPLISWHPFCPSHSSRNHSPHFRVPFKWSQRLLLFNPLHFGLNKDDPAVLSEGVDSPSFFLHPTPSLFFRAVNTRSPRLGDKFCQIE